MPVNMYNVANWCGNLIDLPTVSACWMRVAAAVYFHLIDPFNFKALFIHDAFLEDTKYVRIT